MDDLVKRLRRNAKIKKTSERSKLCTEAANAIETLHRLAFPASVADVEPGNKSIAEIAREHAASLSRLAQR